MSQELSESEVRELIRKAIENKEEQFFILVVEEIDDYTNIHWFTRHITILYGQVQKVVLEEQEENKGNIFKTYIAIIPKTKTVVIKVEEDSDDVNWKSTYFYVFLPNKGWTKVQ